jgi:hypothetical protein
MAFLSKWTQSHDRCPPSPLPPQVRQCHDGTPHTGCMDVGRPKRKADEALEVLEAPRGSDVPCDKRWVRKMARRRSLAARRSATVHRLTARVRSATVHRLTARVHRRRRMRELQVALGTVARRIGDVNMEESPVSGQHAVAAAAAVGGSVMMGQDLLR